MALTHGRSFRIHDKNVVAPYRKRGLVPARCHHSARHQATGGAGTIKVGTMALRTMPSATLPNSSATTTP